MTISVVIPVYNGEKYLESAIISVLKQTRKADEIIVFDDNSNDSSCKIINKYGSEVSYYKNSNGPSGFVNGWNNALKYATCDFVTILHQDDLLYPNFLKESEEALNLNPDVKHLFALCDYIKDDDTVTHSAEDIILENNINIKEKKYNWEEYIQAYQKSYGDMPHIHRCPAVITHRSIFDVCSYDEEAGHIADDDFFYKVGKFTPVLGIMRSLGAYRIHSNSETGSIGDANLVFRLTNDYLYQIRKWKNVDFEKDLIMKYLVQNAFFFKRRLLGYAIKSQSSAMIKNALEISRSLRKEGFKERKISIKVLEILLTFKYSSRVTQKILSLFI